MSRKLHGFTWRHDPLGRTAGQAAGALRTAVRRARPAPAPRVREYGLLSQRRRVSFRDFCKSMPHQTRTLFPVSVPVPLTKSPTQLPALAGTNPTQSCPPQPASLPHGTSAGHERSPVCRLLSAALLRCLGACVVVLACVHGANKMRRASVCTRGCYAWRCGRQSPL